MFLERLELCFSGDIMVSTSTTNPGFLSLFKGLTGGTTKKKTTLNDIKNSGYGQSKIKRNGTGNTSVITYDEKRASQKKAWKDALANKKSSTQSSQTGNSSSNSSSGSGITTLDDAASDEIGNYSNTGSEETDDSSSSSSSTSPLLQGEMSFEELIGEICNGIDLIFATKRSTIVVTDYESIYTEAKYLRDHNKKAVSGEDIKLWQLEEGTYELDVSEYGFYNTVKVNYKNGTVIESYEDLVKVYGEVVIEYDEKTIDKTTAQMKAKAYLAAHVRDFDMSIKANLLWDGDIDVGDIVTIENPLTMRDKIRTEIDKKDPEYYFVMGKSIEWESDKPITGTLELRYGAVSPEKKDVPEAGASYTGSSSSSTSENSSGDIESAVAEVGKKWYKMGYSGECQTYSCVQSTHKGDCWGCSDTLACELISRGITVRILQYSTSASGQHRSVQYKDASGNWKDFPYRTYGFNTLFNNTNGTAHGSEVKCTCG